MAIAGSDALAFFTLRIASGNVLLSAFARVLTWMLLIPARSTRDIWGSRQRKPSQEPWHPGQPRHEEGLQ